VTSFNANAVALCHCVTPGQLRHLQTAIRHQLLKVPKSVAEAPSAAVGATHMAMGRIPAQLAEPVIFEPPAD